jgi:general secretion pathway protein K
LNPVRDEQGFALLIAAIAIAMLSLILGAALELGRQQADATDDLVKRTQLSAALEGALATFEQQLAAGNATPLSKVLRPQKILVGGIAVGVSAQLEFGKVDLNSADPNILSILLDLPGADHEATKHIILAILERRGDGRPAASMTSQGGPEPFAAIRELRALPGVTDRLYQCVRSDLTVFSGLSRPVVRFASVRVRRAMIGLGPSYSNVRDPVSDRPVSAGDILRVALSAKDASGAIDSESVTIRVTGARWQPFWILARDVQSHRDDERGCPVAGSLPS